MSGSEFIMYDNGFKKEMRDPIEGLRESEKRIQLVEPKIKEIETILKRSGVQVIGEIVGSVKARMATIKSDTDIIFKLPEDAGFEDAHNAIYHYTNNPDIYRLVINIPTVVNARFMLKTGENWEEVQDIISDLGF